MFSIDLVQSNENILNAENNGNSQPSIQETIKGIYDATKSVYRRIMQVQDNFQRIISLSSQWTDVPMYSHDKHSKIIQFDHQLAVMKATRFAQIRDASKEIQQLLRVNLLLFHNLSLTDPNSGKFNFNLPLQPINVSDSYIFINNVHFVLN